MKKPLLMVRDADSVILGCMWHDDGDAGPIYPQQQPPDGVVLIDDPAASTFTRAGKDDGAIAYWADGAVAWVETVSLDDLVARAVAAIDAAADAARLTVSPPGRDLEYQRAEAQAQAYKDAAYTGDVPPCVDSWARAKQWTPRNAAIDILATAARWYPALDQIRDLRLNAKEEVRRAAASADVDAIAAQFQTDLTNLMKGLA